MGIRIFIPKMGANIDKVEIGKIYKKEGDTVMKGDVILDIITEKATFAIEAELSGKILVLTCKANEELDVLDEIGYIGEEGEIVPGLKSSKPAEGVKASPLARKIAKDNKIDIDSAFKDFQGIVQEKDVMEYAGHSSGKESVLPLDPVKRAEIQNLEWSRGIIQSSVTITASAGKLREKISRFEKDLGIRITNGEYLSFAAAKLLSKFPKLNAYFEANSIHQYSKINLGVAVGVGESLYVPVIRDADSLGLYQFVSKYRELALKVLRKELGPEMMANGTFTITDMSGLGIVSFSPVINSRQSAILGICASYDSCANAEGKLVFDPKFNLVLAFDHRTANGKYAAEFLRAIADYSA